MDCLVNNYDPQDSMNRSLRTTSTDKEKTDKGKRKRLVKKRLRKKSGERIPVYLTTDFYVGILQIVDGRRAVDDAGAVGAGSVTDHHSGRRSNTSWTGHFAATPLANVGASTWSEGHRTPI